MLQYAPWLVWLVPLVACPLVYVMEAIHPKVRDLFAVLIGFVSAAYALSMVPDVFAAGLGILEKETVQEALLWLPGAVKLKLSVVVDPLSVFMANVAAVIGAIILVYSLGYMAGEEGLSRYYFFMLLFIGGMIGLVMAGNFIQLYIFWEVVGLCSYALIGFWYKRPEARRAGMKAFIVTRAGDVCLMMGIALLFFAIGSFDFLAAKGAVDTLKAAGLLTPIALLMFGGAVGKSAQLPLFVWLPDAMEGPSTVSALIHAATMVKAGVYLVARTHLIFHYSLEWLLTVAYIGAITAFMAATMALVATDIKRVFAYSTISQLGYMMAGLGIALSTTDLGWFASQFHLLSHSIFKALLFLCAGAILHALGTRDMRLMGGLKDDMPITFWTCVIGILALAGVPPLNGFWSKDLLFAAALESGLGVHSMVILGILVITAAITFAYGLRVIALTFLGEKSEYAKTHHPHEAPPVMTIPLIVLAALACVTGFFEKEFEAFMHVHVAHHSAVAPWIPWALTAAALLAGGIPAYLVYYARVVSPESIRKSLAPIHRLLEKGYYFDDFYNAVFVNGLLSLGENFRKVQVGVLNYNMALMVAGLSIFILFFVGGV